MALYRGTFAIVDTRAIRYNVGQVRRQLRPETQLLVTVKANAYGHGAVPVAHTLVAAGVDFLGVASVEEGIALRRAGIATPILVLGAVSYEAAVAASQHDLSVTLTPGCENWPNQPFPKPLKVHLKIDTGMSRLGGRTLGECLAMVRFVRSRPDVVAEGMFTHLACADAPDDEHSVKQMTKFREFVTAVREAGLSPRYVHAANSAGTLRFSDWQEDMVRVGIIAYGYPPSPDFTVPFVPRPALHLYSFVTRVAEIEPGDSVGYGATFVAERRTRIATVPVGYADGYPRSLSNKSDVIIRGRRAPVVGNVCMDQLMVDVTGIDGVEAGQCVTLYGSAAPDTWTAQALLSRDAEAQQAMLKEGFRSGGTARPGLSLDELAGQMGTISYELMCALSLRVPRVYVE